MRFVNDRGEEISDLESWERLAPPASARHLKDERSAREMAVDWIERGAQARVEALLSSHAELGRVVLAHAVAEKKTHFDDVGRGPRNHDLLAFGTAAGQTLVVGVEGKADEPFGQTLARYRDEERSPNSRALERLDRLTRTLFGSTLEEDPALEPIRYQLCSALAGTLADAREEGAETCVLLIHEFRTGATEDRKHAANAEDLEAFLSRLPGESPRIEAADGWIAGPWTIAGDGGRLPASCRVFVAKLVTDLR